MGRYTRVTLSSPLRASRLVPLFALLVLLASTALCASKSYDGWRVLRVQPPSAEVLELLKLQMRGLGADAGEVWHRGSVTDLLLRPEILPTVQEFLDMNRIPSYVHVNDLGEEIRRERSTDSKQGQLYRRGTLNPLDDYLHYSEINEYLDSLADRYPNLVRVMTYGNSYEGRDLKVIQISKYDNEQRPIILVDGGIHAREWISPAMVLYIIQQLVENLSNQDLLERVDWHLIPLLNPDGYEYSHMHDRMWRKTRSRTDNPSCFGADPNRNFDFHWGEVGVSWDPCKETYAGSRPFSEPETAALAEYALTLTGRLRLYVSVHSYGGVLIHPWGYAHYKPNNTPQLMMLGNEVSKALKKAGIRGFFTGNCEDTLGELAAGGSDDWMKGVAGANFSYTLEMPVPSFTTHSSRIKKYVVPTFEGFRVMGSYISILFG